ncbi:hypothetical protein B0H10DRAFT_2448396, partial [Mycena sp. CBHHK59/15]
MVASMKAVDSVTEAESAELPKTARKSRGDDVPGLPSQRRPDDDEGSGDSVQTTSSDSVIFNDDPRFVANNGTPTTAVSPTRNHFRKLRPINTLLRRPYRNSVLKAPPVVSTIDLLPTITLQTPTEDGMSHSSPPNSSPTSTESVKEPSPSDIINHSPLAGLGTICANPPESLRLSARTDSISIPATHSPTPAMDEDPSSPARTKNAAVSSSATTHTTEALSIAQEFEKINGGLYSMVYDDMSKPTASRDFDSELSRSVVSIRSTVDANDSLDIDPPMRGRTRVYNPNTTRQRTDRSAPANFRNHRPLAEDRHSFRNFSHPRHNPSEPINLEFWEDKMDELVSKRAAIAQTIDRLVQELAHNGLTRRDSSKTNTRS